MNLFHIITSQGLLNSGMFAICNLVLGELALYEYQEIPSFTGLTVDFKQNGFYYDPDHGPNWWNYYFEPLTIGDPNDASIALIASAKTAKPFKRRRELTRAESSLLVQKYIHPLPALQAKVDTFVSDHFTGHHIIGVHYRGTDKIEAPRLSYATMLEKITPHVSDTSLIFLATDEEPFLHFMEASFPTRILSIPAHRLSGTLGVHQQRLDPYETGGEALLDCLLLSRCALLIRTSSNLSLWSTYFNPTLPVILLNQRYARTLEPE